ncbi:L-threonylcarbamoyladenylate synthase [Anaerococcus sp.]|uniref:L-threonylcarbamoyladenylate synthase n=1 Tax=Anaerococcus sp. TaxID=1872515 RepID=UPI002589726D|nr:L-threonylcarbamoyladenylate synthase [Anaerococcus sp.]MDU3211801.1 L-threonylcarbamoyladenylate synthase [Anaerococcus sp.]
MITKIFDIDQNNIDEDILKEAASLIKNGELVAFPTETVYGLGADGLNPEATKKIYQAKGRPSDNPLILHISNKTMLYNLSDNVNYEAKKLMELCWPGPLTMILKKSSVVPDTVSAGLDTVAIRMPKDKIALKLIELSNTPIAAPSANISGRPSPTRASDVLADMSGRIPMILDGGEADIGIESTVIDLSENIPTILRPGYYTYEYIRTILDNVKLDDALIDDRSIPKSPGQKYKHYAPKAKVEVYVGDKAYEKLLERASEYKNQGLKVGILAFEESIEKFNEYYNLSLGSKKDLTVMSHVLFTNLRKMDANAVDIIIAEGVEDINLGKSIMNRMKKSASGNVYYL